MIRNCYYIVMKRTKTERKWQSYNEVNIAGNDEEKAQLIAEYFTSVLAPEGKETNKEYPPCEMTSHVTKIEIETAAKSLKLQEWTM